MPLISSPIDGSPMREIERYGVKIDLCPTSGGIWLDKGELEKIIMMIREEALQDGGAHGGAHGGAAAEAYDESWDTYDEDTAPRDQRPRRRKRESIFENLLDIFD